MGQQRIPISETISIVVDTWINTPTVIYAFCETSDLLQTASQLPCWCPYMWGQRWLVPIVRMVDILIEIFLEQSGSCDFLLCLLWVITPSLPDEIFALFLAMRACRWVAVCCMDRHLVELVEQQNHGHHFQQGSSDHGGWNRRQQTVAMTPQWLLLVSPTN